jgi:transcription-repair coupling factor (superfamily II helicase)
MTFNNKYPPLINSLLSRFNISPLVSALKDNTISTVALPEGASVFISEILRNDFDVFYVTSEDAEAEWIFESLRNIDGDNTLFFPEIDVIPYANVFPSTDKLADRMNALEKLSQKRSNGIITVTTAEAFFRILPPVEYFGKSKLHFKIGARFDIEELTRRLVSMAYVREYKVTSQGSFSIRGDIVDIFPPDTHDAVRLNFFDDEIESIRVFNPVTQKSIEELSSFELIPASEFAFKKEIEIDIDEEDFSRNALSHSDFALGYSDFASLIDYSSRKDKTLIIYGRNTYKEYEEVKRKYEIYAPKDIPHKSLIFDIDDIKASRIITISMFKKNENAVDLGLRFPMEIEGGFSAFVENMERIDKKDRRFFIFVENDSLSKRLMSILKKFEPKELSENDTFPDDGKLFLIKLPLEKGFEIKEEQTSLVFLSESDISGKKRLFRKRIRQIDSFIEDIEDIREGEYVVHLNYGIGVFKGIQRINVLGTEKDYILIRYSEDEKLFVPLEQANLIGKYVGAEGRKPSLDSLGGKSWAKKRERVKRSVEEFASRLVAIYAKRDAIQGHSFGGDTVWQKDFEDRFQYMETPDQISVIEEIKSDMEKLRPMDRLLCGDVGFGKTEVAMRAVFKAMMDGRQVAVIAPTTVLCEQHFYTFEERFKGFPVNIAMVSRFTSGKEFKAIIRKAEEHKLDILIGTHKLFSDKLKFHSLGLVVIDEEHKFGVEQKERLKEKYPFVDFLSLSATPIPRTLNMALSAVRDISLLQTPPDMRIPVQTFVSDFSFDVVKYAVEYELSRGGQVFFVHNTIKRLPEYAFAIEQLVPRAKVAIGHGQMNEEELETEFIGFVKGQYNVFVCTTIIDSGLDISNANTIIISDSHRYGLAQLYQLKGRVGRSRREGFAYFLYPREKALTENAQKRLFVINEYTDLGAGFNIAMKDLEIRGAGNILGREQHGNIIAVGFDMYMRLLKDEVKKIKGEYHETFETLIDLNYDAYIPDTFISDPAVKMEIYKRIVSVNNEDEIRELSIELSDRFGKIPEEVSTLFEISRLKIISRDMGIESLIEKDKYIEIAFSNRSKVDPVKVINIRQIGKHEIDISPQFKNRIFYKRFSSNVSMKVKRLVSFLSDIREK